MLKHQVRCALAFGGLLVFELDHQPRTGAPPVVARPLRRALRTDVKWRAAVTAVRSGAVMRQDVELRISASSASHDALSIARPQNRNTRSISAASGRMMGIVCGRPS